MNSVRINIDRIAFNVRKHLLALVQLELQLWPLMAAVAPLSQIAQQSASGKTERKLNNLQFLLIL